MTDTPETDAMSMTDDPLDFIAMIEHARKLERERDQAREQIKYNLETTLILERMIYKEREKSEELLAEIANLRTEIKKALL